MCVWGSCLGSSFGGTPSPGYFPGDTSALWSRGGLAEGWGAAAPSPWGRGMPPFSVLPAAQLATGLTSPKPHLRGQRGLWLLGLCCAQLTLGVPDPQGWERAHPRQLWGPLSLGLCY